MTLVSQIAALAAIVGIGVVYPYPQNVLLAAFGTPSPYYRTRRTFVSTTSLLNNRL
jgi:hypothetical protein